MNKKIYLLLFLIVVGNLSVLAQQNNNHFQLSFGALYERGLDVTLAYEHGTKYHNAWEYFGTYYIKYSKDRSVGHITSDSFWNSYKSWHLGICYKPCVKRGRNYHGNVRIGASGGSDMDKFIGGIHVGYEHTFAFNQGWELFFQLREDIAIVGKDIFRTGASVGFKVPISL